MHKPQTDNTINTNNTSVITNTKTLTELSGINRFCVFVNKNNNNNNSNNTNNGESHDNANRKKYRPKNASHKPHYTNNIHHNDPEVGVNNFKEKSLSTYDIENNVDSVVGNDKFLSSTWSIWVHRTDCTGWTEDTYKHVYTIKSIGTFWRFFNNFHLFDKYANQFFVMRGLIKPVWEDNGNRTGGICSIKLDCYSRSGKIDIGSEVMICLCLLMMNETLIQNNEEINGISYSIKNKCVLIKIWYRDYHSNITDKLPISFFNKLDVIMKNANKNNYGDKKNENYISIQCKPIKPESTDETE